MSDLDDIYGAQLLSLAANIGRIGRLEAPDASARAHSKLCGSTVHVDLCMQDGIVTDYAHDVRACLLGQAAAAVMASQIVGSSADELRAIAGQMRKMLRDCGTPPQGRWGDLSRLEPVRDYRARHTSTLLVFDAVEDALAQIEAGEQVRAKAGEHAR
jgi:NifU-like protein involved in Fe-S cluster formation